MQIKHINQSGLYVKPSGRIDINSAMEFGTQVNDALDGISELILDFSDVNYISSIGLRVLLEFQKRMKEQGTMNLMNVSPEVMNIFNMTGFTNILTII